MNGFSWAYYTICCFLGLSGPVLLWGQQLVEKLPAAINTATYDESSPVISTNTSLLYFTRTASPDFCNTLIVNDEDLSTALDEGSYLAKLGQIYGQIASTHIPDPVNSAFNQDIWIAELTDTALTVRHPCFPLNNALPNSVVSTSHHPANLIVINQFFRDGSMSGGFSMVRRLGAGEYTFPQPLHIYDFYNLAPDINLSMSNDGDIIIFSLKRLDSYGQNDLYISFLIREGIWSAPLHMGKPLNSSFQETSPFLTNDKRRLYFSSNRESSMGGNDIFVSDRLDHTWLNWSEPVPLDPPINSEFDDTQPFIDPDNGFMYFSSKRDGSSDIFRIPLTAHGSPESQVRIPSNTVVTRFCTTGDADRKFAEQTPPDGPPGNAKPADDAEVRRQEDRLSLGSNGRDPQPAHGLDFPSGEVPSFHLQPVYFIKTTPVIKKSSYQTLGNLLGFMAANPELAVHIEGHTDNVGYELELMELSWKRAEKIKSYLIENGIDPDRITTLGLGPSKPVTDNSTEVKRRQNRRVEFRFLKR